MEIPGFSGTAQVGQHPQPMLFRSDGWVGPRGLHSARSGLIAEDRYSTRLNPRRTPCQQTAKTAVSAKWGTIFGGIQVSNNFYKGFAMITKKPFSNSGPSKLPATDAPRSDRPTEALERGYGDELGGYLVEPTDDEPRRPAGSGSVASRPSEKPASGDRSS
ncbi:MAG: hypothetical protein LH632_12790 [Rhodoferax sp.]|nr:hypothetical protein [Rhodoferax sp.]